MNITADLIMDFANNGTEVVMKEGTSINLNYEVGIPELEVTLYTNN